MKVVETKMGIDKEGNAVVIHVCEAGVFEDHLKFKVGFALARDQQRGGYILFAFRGNPKQPLAFIKDREKAVAFIKSILEKGGYKWIVQYKSEVEQVDGMYAFFVPFNAEGWNEITPDIRTTLEQMLQYLEG